MRVIKKYVSIETLKGFFLFLIYAFPMYILSLILASNHKYTNLWIICERRNEARDNGLYLFKYINETNDKIKAFYIIDKTSEDLSKLKKYKNIIYFGTYKHYLYYFLSNRHISTHGSGYGCMPNMYACRLLELLISSKAKSIFLQHGVTMNYLENLIQEKTNIDLFVCGAHPEYKYIKKNYGYKEEVVQYLGLARFDGLISNSNKNQIMFMPTWRIWLDKVSKEAFLKTDYFQQIQSVINSKKLRSILKKSNTKFILCLHPNVQKYIELFNTHNENIIIASTKDYDIQNLLKESTLLITDYSSVSFDFAYMNKPLIYFQFDYKDFREKQYPTGYFDFHENGFGPVVESENDLINNIEEMQKKKFQINSRYLKRINDTFLIRDKNNCKRIYEYILKL